MGKCASCGADSVGTVPIVGRAMELCAGCTPPGAKLVAVCEGPSPAPGPDGWTYEGWRYIELEPNPKPPPELPVRETTPDILHGSAWDLVWGDCLEFLRTLPDNCVDAIVTDPPSGTGFMNADWDKNRGGRDRWIAWLQAIFVELERVAKPGAFAIVWALPRTSHWTAMAVENARFRICDRLAHLFGQGFPKSHDVSKAIDKLYGAERPIIGTRMLGGNAAVSTKDKGGTYGVQVGTAPAIEVPITAPATADAKKWDGWGTALKPACEDWWLARTELSESSVARNVLRWGTGAIYVDGARIFTNWNEVDRPDTWKASGHSAQPESDKIAAPPGNGIDCHPLGRFPAHLLLSHSPHCRPVGALEVQRPLKAKTSAADGNGIYGDGLNAAPIVLADGVERQHVYDCADDCPVRMLDEQTGLLKAGRAIRHRSGGNTFGGEERKPTMEDLGYGDTGTASRFFYIAKPSTAEREFGLEDFEPETVNDGRESEIDNPFQRGETERKNPHITVKSIKLMRYLIRLVTPPGDLVLDPFCGSGTTGQACLRTGRRFLGIERDEKWAEIARMRLRAFENGSTLAAAMTGQEALFAEGR